MKSTNPTTLLISSGKGDCKMGQTQFTVANQIFCLQLDDAANRGGTVVRLNDGLEASFSSQDCLLDLLEGMIGRRTWQAHQEQIVATLATLTSCA